MLDDKQSSIVRPKAVPPMFTPVLTPNTQSSTNMSNNINRTSQQALIEMGTMIRKHDPEATRLYDCIAQVKVFLYNSVDLRWENSANIEGNLCAYERQQIMNNKICPSYAFAIINGDKSLIQPITSDMVQHADKLRLFYEVARNSRREVFCLHFLTEAECLRLHAFLNRSIQVLRNLAEQQQQQQQQLQLQQQQQQQQQQLQQQQQIRTILPSVPVDPQTQMNGQITPNIPIQQTPPNVYRQQIPQQQIITPNPTIPTTPQFGSSRVNHNQTPTRLTASSILAAQQHQINSYPPQIPIDLMNTNLIRLTPTIPVTSVVPNEVPKPIEQTQFPPSPIPLTNGNNNNSSSSEDPTSSLKRLLNIRGQSGLENLSLDDGPVFPKQATSQNLLDLMPPSAFEPITATPPSPVVAIGAERVKHRLSTQLNPIMSREHFRNVLLHLVQNDDHFLDIIYQACLTHPPTSH